MGFCMFGRTQLPLLFNVVMMMLIIATRQGLCQSPLSKFSALIVFGDSLVDPGNNNHLLSMAKANYPPYGRDFPHNIATGRFTNGRLAIDFIAQGLGLKNTVPAYLDPKLNPNDLLTGVSFGSATSGYDNRTARSFNVLPLWKQLTLFREYKNKLAKNFGQNIAQNTVKNALFFVVMGSNDLAFNYFLFPSTRIKYTLRQYQEKLLNAACNLLEELMKEGARRIAVVGLPPIGCMPLSRSLNPNPTLLEKTQCLPDHNKAAQEFNTMFQPRIDVLNSVVSSSDIKIKYVDIYTPFSDMYATQAQQGIEVRNGCCAVGSLETGFCIPFSPACKNTARYFFWDSFHPTEWVYQKLAQVVLERDLLTFDTATFN